MTSTADDSPAFSFPGPLRAGARPGTNRLVSETPGGWRVRSCPPDSSKRRGGQYTGTRTSRWRTFGPPRLRQATAMFSAGSLASSGPRLGPVPAPASLSRRRSREPRPAGRRADEVGVAGLGEEPSHVRQRRDERLARNGHVDVPGRVGARRAHPGGAVALDDPDQRPAPRLVHSTPARAIAHRGVHHEARRRLAVGAIVPVDLADDPARQGHVTAPGKSDDPHRLAQKWRPAGARRHAVSGVDLEQREVEVRRVTMGEHGGAHPRAVSAIASEDDVDLLLTDGSRHGMAAGHDEAVRPALRPPGRKHDAGPGPHPAALLLLDDDLDGRRQDALEDLLSAGLPQPSDGAATHERSDHRPESDRAQVLEPSSHYLASR